MSGQSQTGGGSATGRERATAQNQTTGEGPSRPPSRQRDPITPVNPEGDNGGSSGAGNERNENNEETPPETPEYLLNPPNVGLFVQRLPNILATARHNEVWGVTLRNGNDKPTVNILIKFLHANDGDLEKADRHLTSVLQWRRQMAPLHLANALHNHYRFSDLGYLSNFRGTGGQRVIMTWFVHGAARDAKTTFEEDTQFLHWYVGLMELAAHALKINDSTTVMDYYDRDPYKVLQVQDFRNVNFTRTYPKIRRCVQLTMDIMPLAYPELLAERYFVNIPFTRGCRFRLPKIFQSKNTTRKFTPIRNGHDLAARFSEPLQAMIPPIYGGKGQPLTTSSREVGLAPPPPTLAPSAYQGVPAYSSQTTPPY